MRTRLVRLVQDLQNYCKEALSSPTAEDMMLEFNIKTSREWNHHKTLHGADEATFDTRADPPNQKTDRARNSGFPKSKQNRKNERRKRNITTRTTTDSYCSNTSSRSSHSKRQHKVAEPSLLPCVQAGMQMELTVLSLVCLLLHQPALFTGCLPACQNLSGLILNVQLATRV